MNLMSTKACNKFSNHEKETDWWMTVYSCYKVSDNRNRLASHMFHNIKCNYKSMTSLINTLKMVIAAERGKHTHAVTGTESTSGWDQ